MELGMEKSLLEKTSTTNNDVDSSTPLNSVVLPSSSSSPSLLPPSNASAKPTSTCTTTVEIPLRHTFDQSCWKRRTLLEKTLFFLLVVMVIVVIVMVISAAMWSNRTDASKNVCHTEECVTTASRILGAMDKMVDPCDDFFEHACGTWNRANIIPDDRSSYNTFRKLGDELQGILRVLFEEPITENETLATKNVKHLFQSCMNMSLIEMRQDEPLTTLLKELSGWPVLDKQWNESNFVLEELLAKLRLLSNKILIHNTVGADDKNSDVYIIFLDQAQLGMPSRDYFLTTRNEKSLQTYREFATNVAKALGAEDALATKEIKDMVDFEIQLANITIPEEYRRDTEAIYKRYTISGLSNITKDFDWLKYLQLAFKHVNININSSEEVVVYSTNYLAAMGMLIKSTPKRTLANYLIWHIVMNRISNLPQKFLDLKRNYNKAIQGTAQEQPRWRTCINYVNENLGMAVGRLFVSKHFDEEAKATAMGMIHNIRDAFVELLAEVEWMDDGTKLVAKEKADAIQEKIGYPDYIMNDTALNMDYEGVRIDPHMYFENVLSNLNVAARNNLQNLRRPVDKSRWATAPAVVNAFYSATRNQIMFPAGILQPPFYHASYPKSMNFGGIAMVIGHELTHGFDDRGRQYDKDGNLKQWWSNNVIEKFKEKAQCIIDQYSNYTVNEAGLNLNGKQTQGENIADNGGLKQAFRAYTRWVERSRTEENLLPGLQLTHKQLFFLNFAQIWCGTARPESYVQSILVGRHSPGRFRVIGALSNSKDFAEAYNCPVGSKMNPEKKCSVW